MKPLRLEIEAFGSFAGRTEVDFARLGDERLFLVHGPTGAGKSTLLEAICFALYGAPAGTTETAAATHLRSQHAAPDQLTRVCLDFALGDTRYRVERTPRQLRPKRRGGEGFVEERGTAVLYRWKDGVAIDDSTPGEPLATKQSDVDAEIKGLLSLDRAQFRQVILLPQGEFRKLLEASTKDRQAILAKLFDIDRYADLERRLKREADRLKDELGDLEQQRTGLLASAEVESLDAFEVRQKDLAVELEQARTRLAEATARVEAVREEQSRARRDHEKLAERAAARQAFAAFDARRPEFENERLRLREAERAEPAAVAIDLRHVRAAALAAAKEREEAARAAAQASAIALETARNEEFVAREREPELRALDEALASLRTAGERVDRLEALRATESRQEAACEALATSARQEARRVAVLSAERAEAEAAHAAQRELAAGHAAAVDRLAWLEKDARFRQRESKLRARIAELDEHVASVEARLDVARREVSEAEAAHATAIARDRERVTARLAEALESGAPCPVCGSVEHPAPARDDSADEPNPDARAGQGGSSLEALAARLTECRAALEAPVARAAGLASERASEARALAELHEEWIAAGGPAEDAGIGQREDPSLDRLEAARERVEASERAIATARESEVQLAALREQIEETRLRAEKAARDEAAARAALVERAGSIRALEAELPAQARTRAALEGAQAETMGRRKALQQRIEETTAAARGAEADRARWDSAVAERGAEIARAQTDLAQAEAALATALRTAGMDSAEVALEARLSPESREESRTRIEVFARDREVARQRLGQATEAAAEAVAVDLEALAARVDAAAAAADEAREIAAGLEGRARSFAQVADALAAHAERSGALLARYERVGGLSEIASGNNPRRLSFERFVLAAFLDEVLALASVSLRRMSKGRYDMRRLSELEDRRKGFGLDLAVWDGHTGQERPVATLSGGESFCAALALALGLAEVVQRHSGGTRLDAIFVDEGFGSLDPESLELALETLVELQSGGRLVGLISHVPELKERIETRLEVRPGKGGSQLELSMP